MSRVEELVVRLNNELGWGIGPAMLCQEAAALLTEQAGEIERLRSALGAIIPRFHRALLATGTEPEYADEAVAEYRAALQVKE